MPAGRPPQKTALVESLSGPEELKTRLRVILATLSGELTIAQACEQLNVGESRFHELRKQALEGALKAIEPGQSGRPGKEVTPEEAKLQELQNQVTELEFQLRTSKVQVELAQALPHVLHIEPTEIETTTPPSKKRRRRPNYRHRWE
jgi:transposase-like protein